MGVRSVIIIGAGMGGLSAALYLARAGVSVRVLEARAEPGGLAGSLQLDGMTFDAGPYILLDRPGLEFAFRALGLELADHVALRKLEDVYEVLHADGTRVRFHADLGATAAGFERQWPGSGASYVRYVNWVSAIHRRLEPLQRTSRPSLWTLICTGGWRHIPFLLRSLGSVLERSGLPAAVQASLAIWTHVAGQRVDAAPSPLALVPALIHGVGAYYALDGIGCIPRVLAAQAQAAGVVFSYGVKATSIRRANGRARIVQTEAGAFEADAILSNAAGVGTYLELLESPPPRLRARLEPLPLQSPGVIAYLAVKGGPKAQYLRFHLPGGDEHCRCLVMPAAVDATLKQNGWHPARLLVPMDHQRAQAAGDEGQRHYLERILAEPWWREHVDDFRVLATRTPANWGRLYHLYKDSMNPVMTARFMRAGRLAHRSPDVPGLYLAGSATHPGQWVSFCAVSGVLAARQVLEDLM